MEANRIEVPGRNTVFMSNEYKKVHLGNNSHIIKFVAEILNQKIKGPFDIHPKGNSLAVVDFIDELFTFKNDEISTFLAGNEALLEITDIYVDINSKTQEKHYFADMKIVYSYEQ